MRLQPVQLRPDQRLLCCSCGKWVGGKHKYMAQAEEVFADLDGAAFKDFYCKPCADDQRAVRAAWQLATESAWDRDERKYREYRNRTQHGPYFTGD